MVPGLKHTAYKVAKTSWTLYDGLTAPSPLVLTKAWPAGFTGRVAVTVTSETGHTDCAGSVTVGSETKSFTTSGQRLTFTNYLSALPAISCSGLDCHILVEVITTGGQPYYEETLTAVTCRWTATQKSFRNSAGDWETSDAEVLTTSTACNATDTMRYEGVDYVVRQVNPYAKLSGREFLRRLYVTR